MSRLTTVALLFLIGVSGIETSDECSYLGLLRHLNLMNANDALSIVRPVKNWKTPTIVCIDMLLFGILEVDEKSQTVTTHIWTQVRWINEFLRWNSSDFCGINTLVVPKTKLWIPDICIQEDTSDTSSTQDSPLLTVGPQGWTHTYWRQRLTTTCQLNLHQFPFDMQHCSITFTSMNYLEDDMRLGSFSNGAILSSVSEEIMMTQGEWQLVNISITPYSFKQMNESQSKLIYTVSIMRKPMLYIINLIVPLLYFLFLDLASFFIKGEKLNFKVTVLLSISVLLLILQDMLPSTEEKLPLIASYCMVVFTLVWLSILETMLVEFLMELDCHCGNKPQSSDDTQEVEMQLESNSIKNPAAAEVKGQARPEMTRPSECDLLMLILSEVKAARQATGSHVKVDRQPGRYVRLAQIIDSVYFVFYLLTVVVYMAYMNTKWIGCYYENLK